MPCFGPSVEEPENRLIPAEIAETAQRTQREFKPATESCLKRQNDLQNVELFY